MITPAELNDLRADLRYRRNVESSLNRSRRLKRSSYVLDLLRKLVLTILRNQQSRGSVRHICYVLAGKFQVIEKTEQDFAEIQRNLADWRKQALIPFGLFVDDTRPLSVPATFNSMSEAVADARDNYRQAMWANQLYQPEVWVEKLAVCNIIEPVTDTWAVPLLPVRGFSGLEVEYEAAQRFRQIVERGRQPVVLHLGD